MVPAGSEPDDIPLVAVASVPAVIKLPPVMLPVAEINTAVIKLPAVMLPVELIKPAV
jgi:hypothetical protein